MGNWTGTNGGMRIDLVDPDPEQVTLSDIATGLGNVCRFGGQLKTWYSVAEHSIKVSEMVRPDLRMIALLHDATEAYICDIPTPLKRELGDAYKVIEDRLARAIGARFGLGDVLADLPEQVMMVDKIMAVTERDALQAQPANWGPDYENVMRYPQFHRRYTDNEEAREAFLRRFNELENLLKRKAA